MSVPRGTPRGLESQAALAEDQLRRIAALERASGSGGGGSGGGPALMLLSGRYEYDGNSGTGYGLQIVYDKAFASPPEVTATVYQNTSGSLAGYYVKVNDNNAANLRFRHYTTNGFWGDGVPGTVLWHAVGVPLDPDDANVGTGPQGPEGPQGPAGGALATKMTLVRYPTAGSSGSFVKADYPGLVYVEAEVFGGGGGGGGAPSCGAGQVSGGGGGGAGGYGYRVIQADDLAASEPYTVGSGGAGGVGATSTNGATGTQSTFAGCIALGGAGGKTLAPVAMNFANAQPGNGGTVNGSYDYRKRGQQGNPATFAGDRNFGGIGADCMYGRGGNGGNAITNTGANGGNGEFGGGGGGAANRAGTASNRDGGNGGNGGVHLRVYQAVPFTL